MLGPMGSILQVVRIISSFPAIEGLRGDAEIVAGETGIAIMEIVVIKLFEPLPGFLIAWGCLSSIYIPVSCCRHS